MSELGSPERREVPELTISGLFRLSAPTKLEFGADGKVMPAGGEPIFAVKEIPYGKQDEFAWRLVAHLEGVEKAIYRQDKIYAVAIGTIPELLSDLEDGEIRYIRQDDYNEAYLRKYGGGIVGPMFL